MNISPVSQGLSAACIARFESGLVLEAHHLLDDDAFPLTKNMVGNTLTPP